MREIRSICVNCGSNPGANPAFGEAGRLLGHELAARGLGLVYGGAKVGVMGAVAAGVLEKGGSAIGVIPHFFVTKEVAHDGLDELIVVDSMHARKSRMADLSDGFVALPGGMGTFEELLEIVTWAQLRFHNKPCGLLNVDGYFDHLLAYLDHAEAEGFLRSENRQMLLADATPVGLIGQFERYTAPRVDKWIDARKEA